MWLRTILGLILAWLLANLFRQVQESLFPRDPTDTRRGGRSSDGSRSRSSGSRSGRGPAGRSAPSSRARRRREALRVLGLQQGASGAEIRRAYRELAAKYHPDRVAHLGPELVELTSEKFREVREAYELLDGSR